VLFIRGAYWVIFDEVVGAQAREMEARFQFAPLRLTLDRRARLFRTLRQNRPNLELIVVGPHRGTRMKLAIATGATDPVAGWVSDGEDVPAPLARIHVSGAPLRLVTVVYPFIAGVSSGVRTKTVAGLPDGVFGMHLRRGRERRDTILYSWDGTPLPVDGATLLSPVAVVTAQERLSVQGSDWAAF
jgi:hypothetical protein